MEDRPNLVPEDEVAEQKILDPVHRSDSEDSSDSESTSDSEGTRARSLRDDVSLMSGLGDVDEAKSVSDASDGEPEGQEDHHVAADDAEGSDAGSEREDDHPGAVDDAEGSDAGSGLEEDHHVAADDAEGSDAGSGLEEGHHVAADDAEGSSESEGSEGSDADSELGEEHKSVGSRRPGALRRDSFDDIPGLVQINAPQDAETIPDTYYTGDAESQHRPSLGIRGRMADRDPRRTQSVRRMSPFSIQLGRQPQVGPNSPGRAHQLRIQTWQNLQDLAVDERMQMIARAMSLVRMSPATEVPRVLPVEDLRRIREDSAVLYREATQLWLISRRDFIRMGLTGFSESFLLVMLLFAVEAMYAHWAVGRHLQPQNSPYWHTTYIAILAGFAFCGFFLFSICILRPLLEDRFSRFHYDNLFHAFLGVTYYVKVRMLLELLVSGSVAYAIGSQSSPEALIDPESRIKILSYTMLTGLWSGLAVRAGAELLDRLQDPIRDRLIIPLQQRVSVGYQTAQTGVVTAGAAVGGATLMAATWGWQRAAQFAGATTRGIRQSGMWMGRQVVNTAEAMVFYAQRTRPEGDLEAQLIAPNDPQRYGMADERTLG